ncbi:deoxyuridine 5'-triphosphate nucleotidohydrolase [Rhagoletis pomonella]|uniref:deoxyuridine 5'-triphosphate nucleotidohydrolase n=1 Tax=Rhagoletis pomonella TaxID=28610 RepID=UPI00177E3F5B|nr:deoxyuridine 5'-triphosphate nucleotidohydrolase [Rhagoletis pomonella]XP_036332023.1 deoxyuridine 5'-triphosphate nucleotidohydrolase [Rhagoletis pomonella]
MSAEALKKKLEETELPEPKKMKVDSKCVLRFAKLTEHALEPVRGSARAAGLDLRSAYDLLVPARGKAIVKTDLQVQVPEGSYGRVAPRSGLAVKNFIDVGAGVVDEDYRGNLGVVLFNHSDADFEVKRGDRIAQFICERIFYPELEEVDKLDATERGTGGFGSTGVKEVSAKNGNGAAPMEAEDGKPSEDTSKEPESKVDSVEAAESKEVAKESTTNEKVSEVANGSTAVATA